MDADQESFMNDDNNSPIKVGNPLVRMIRKVTKKNETEKKKKKKKNVTVEMLQPSRYKPSNLNQMAEETQFTKSNFNYQLNHYLLFYTPLKVFFVPVVCQMNQILRESFGQSH